MKVGDVVYIFVQHSLFECPLSWARVVAISPRGCIAVERDPDSNRPRYDYQDHTAPVHGERRPSSEVFASLALAIKERSDSPSWAYRAEFRGEANATAHWAADLAKLTPENVPPHYTTDEAKAATARRSAEQREQWKREKADHEAKSQAEHVALLLDEIRALKVAITPALESAIAAYVATGSIANLIRDVLAGDNLVSSAQERPVHVAST